MDTGWVPQGEKGSVDAGTVLPKGGKAEVAVTWSMGVTKIPMGVRHGSFQLHSLARRLGGITRW